MFVWYSPQLHMPLSSSHATVFVLLDCSWNPITIKLPVNITGAHTQVHPASSVSWTFFSTIPKHICLRERTIVVVWHHKTVANICPVLCSTRRMRTIRNHAYNTLTRYSSLQLFPLTIHWKCYILWYNNYWGIFRSPLPWRGPWFGAVDHQHEI